MQLFSIPKNYEELHNEELKAVADNYEANNVLERTYREIEASLEHFTGEIETGVTFVYF